MSICFRFALTTLLVAISMLAACGSSHKTATTSEPVTVFAAASLTETFRDVKTRLKKDDPGLSITYNFGGSGALVTQIKQGAPADVVATADTSTMQQLVSADLVEPSTVFAKNKLEILVAPGNPKNIHGLNDLANSELLVVLCDSAVPAGKYAAQSLQAANVTVKPVSKETDVKAAVAKVTSGEADATIVYQTDMTAAGSEATGVVIPDAQNVTAEYPIAIVKATKHHDAAAAFVTAVTSSAGQADLNKRGFLSAR